MIVVGIILFALLVIVHEIGHYIAARRNGVDVEEFGIGFPPKIFGRKMGKHQTLYSLNLIPLGGFVRLKGESDTDKATHSFGRAPLKAKVKILLAGVGMNVLAVYVIMLILALTSLPKVLPNQFTISSDEQHQSAKVLVTQITPDSPASNIGLAVGDELISIDGEDISTAAELKAITAKRANKSVTVVYEQSGQQKAVRTKLTSENGEGKLGVVPFDISSTRYTWSAPIVAAGATLQMLWLTITGIFGTVIALVGGIFVSSTPGSATDNVTGPVGVFVLLRSVGSFGLSYLLVLIASISASLAVVNALPIPALDGGRLALILLGRARHKPISAKTESAVHNIGFLALIILIILITIIDVRRFF